MSASPFALVRTIKVGDHKVTFSVPSGEVGDTVSTFIEWSPPRTHQLTPAELRAFRAGRARVIAELQRVTGMRSSVVREGA